MSADTFRYSAAFKLYDPDGLQVYLHVGGDDPSQHVADFLSYLASLRALGLTTSPPGEAPGAQVEAIDGYVMGETSKGDACVYLYSALHKLQFKYATVYVERFGDLPFTPSGRVWQGSAPMRDDAERKGYLVEIDPPIEVVMGPQLNADGTPRLSEKGKPLYEFVHVKGTLATAAPSPTSPSPSPTSPTPSSTPSSAPPAPATTAAPAQKTILSAPQYACPRCGSDWRYYNPDCKQHIQPDGESAPEVARGKTALDPATLRLWLRNEAYRFGSRKCSQYQRHNLSSAWKMLVADEDLRRRAKKSLTGYESVGEMPDAIVLAMHAWLRPAGNNGEIHLTDSMAADEIAVLLDILR